MPAVVSSEAKYQQFGRSDQGSVGLYKCMHNIKGVCEGEGEGG